MSVLHFVVANEVWSCVNPMVVILFGAICRSEPPFTAETSIVPIYCNTTSREHNITVP